MAFDYYNGYKPIVQQNLWLTRLARALHLVAAVGIVAQRKMKQFQSRVASIRTIANGYYELVFTWPSSVGEPVPGQFVSVKSFGTTDLILRRPFAVSAYDPEQGTASIIFQRRGKATAMLASRVPGDLVDIVGPLGNSFPALEGASQLLVGGGVGLGPIIFFGNSLVARGLQPTVILGFRDDSFFPSILAKEGSLRFDPVVCTEDGSMGFSGTTVAWLRDQAARIPGRFEANVVHACGPNAMMAGCSRFCSEHDLQCWVSMEQTMGCGVGACIGCAIPVSGKERFARVCTEGPVFDSSKILWEQME